MHAQIVVHHRIRVGAHSARARGMPALHIPSEIFAQRRLWPELTRRDLDRLRTSDADVLSYFARDSHTIHQYVDIRFGLARAVFDGRRIHWVGGAKSDPADSLRTLDDGGDGEGVLVR